MADLSELIAEDALINGDLKKLAMYLRENIELGSAFRNRIADALDPDTEGEIKLVIKYTKRGRPNNSAAHSPADIALFIYNNMQNSENKQLKSALIEAAEFFHIDESLAGKYYRKYKDAIENSNQD